MILLLNPPQGHLSEGYGKLCSIYLKLLITKMEFHIKVSCPDLCGVIVKMQRWLLLEDLPSPSQ